MAGTAPRDTGFGANDAAHWDAVYAAKEEQAVSWYQLTPVASLRMLDVLGASVDDAIVDVGGGSGALATALAGRGHRDVTVVELSVEAISRARRRGRGQIALIHADVLDWHPSRRYEVWHDRAVFHFLTEPTARDRYRETLRRALTPGGGVAIGAFASDGPTSCSGLPVQRYDPASLITAVGEGFTAVAAEREEHRTPTGKVQPFTWVALRRDT